jgi:hypothetical protein
MQGEKDLSGTVEAIVGNLQEIMRSEVRLARTEIKENVAQASRAGATLGVGIGIGLYAVAFLLAGAMWALSMVIPLWAAALAVGIALVIVAAVMISLGRKGLGHVHAKPDRTIRTMKENVQWVRHRAT